METTSDCDEVHENHEQCQEIVVDLDEEIVNEHNSRLEENEVSE
jgi:hypothetical protein